MGNVMRMLRDEKGYNQNKEVKVTLFLTENTCM